MLIQFLQGFMCYYDTILIKHKLTKTSFTNAIRGANEIARVHNNF